MSNRVSGEMLSECYVPIVICGLRQNTYLDKEFCKSPNDILPCPGCLKRYFRQKPFLNRIVYIISLPWLNNFVNLMIGVLIPELIIIRRPPSVHPVHSIIDQIILFCKDVLRKNNSKIQWKSSCTNSHRCLFDIYPSLHL